MSQKTFIVNGRTVVHKESQGFAEALSINLKGDDKIPTPFTVRAESADLDNLCSGLQVNGNPCATIDSFVSKCSGDEEGDGGGIHSGTVGDRCDFLTASVDTLVSDSGFMINGKPVVREGDSFILNQRNSALTVWQQDKGRILNNAPDSAGDTSEVPTPYLIDISVLGVDPCLSNQYLALSEENSLKPEKLLSCALHSEDKDQYWRRISFNNLTPEPKQLMLHVLSDTSSALSIPFPAALQTTSTKEADKPEYHQQSNCLIPVKFSQHFIPDDGKIKPIKGDFSDILRLDSSIRLSIYSRLIHYQLSSRQKRLENENTRLSNFFKIEQLLPREEESAKPSPIKAFDQSWYDLIGPRLRYLVDQYFISEKKQPSLRAGFLYIYLNGRLWRELALDPMGMASEVDLQKHAANDSRKASGSTDNWVYFPWKIADKSFEIEVAFSEVQWSWARINYFGGVDENDLRFKEQQLAAPSSDADCQTRREKRFLRLDLSTFVQSEPDHSVCANNNIIHAFCKEDKIPVIYLPDPLCLVSNGLQDIQNLTKHLEELAQAIQLEPHFLTAMTSYRYFFDARTAHNESFSDSEQALEKQKIAAELYKDKKRYSADYLKQMAKDEFPDQVWEGLSEDEAFDHYFALHLDMHSKGALAKRIQEGKPNEMKQQQQYLDEPRLKALLKVELRARLREMIRLIQQTLVSLIERPEEGLAVTSLSPTVKTLTELSYVEALRDYFSLGPYHYEKAFAALAGLTTWLTSEPAQVDRDLDISDDFDGKPTVGQRFIHTLLDKKHPLHPMIFADKAAVTSAKEAIFHNEWEDEDNQGCGDFSGPRFAYSWYHIENLSLLKILNKTADVIHEVVSSFALNVMTAVSQADESTTASAHELIYLLLQSSNHNILSTVKPIQTLDSNQNELIIGIHTNIFKKNRKPESPNTGKVIDFNDKAVKGKPFNVKMNPDGEALVTHHFPRKNAIIDAIEAQNDLKAYIENPPAGIAARNHYKLDLKTPIYILKPNASRSIFSTAAAEAANEATPWPSSLSRVLDKGTALLVENAAKIDRAATSILTIFSALNLYTVQRDYFKKMKLENLTGLDKTELASSFFAFAYSIETLSTSIVKFENVVKFYNKWSLAKEFLKKGKERFLLLTPLAAIGAAGLALSFSSNIFQMFTLFQEHDASGAGTKGLLAMVNLGGFFSILGTAASLYLKQASEKLALTEGISIAEATALVTERFMLEQGIRFSVLRILLPFSSSGIGVLLICCGLILEIIYEWCKDKPLTHWVKNSHFSQTKLSTLQQNETDFDKVLSLYSLLFEPEAKLQRSTTDKDGNIQLRLTISLPYFIISKHRLDIHTLLVKRRNAVAYSKLTQHVSQSSSLTPQTVSYFFNNESQLTEVELLYELKHDIIKPESHLYGNNAMFKFYEIQSFFRLHLEQDMILPAVKFKHHYLKAEQYSLEPQADSSWFTTETIDIL